MKTNLRTGTYVTTNVVGEAVKAFVPGQLPFDPPLDLSAIQPLFDQALHLLGQLDSATTLLPNISLFIYFYVRKEALLSSQIEGTQSSLDDLLLYEAGASPSTPLEDVEEVSHYIQALQHGLKRIHGNFPLSLRLIQEMHQLLLNQGRGSTKQPGEFRRSQNWIGGTRPGNAAFVPPPPQQVLELMGNLELYLHNQYGKTPTLLKAAIAHVQFETIHPFLDGNGRIGRLLITLLLCVEGVLKEPALYLSLYFKKHRNVYYDLLSRVRTQGVWEEWVIYFLEGVIETAKEGIETAKHMAKIFEEDTKKIETLGKGRESALKVFKYLQQKGLCQIPKTSKVLKLSQPTVTLALKNLVNLGIVAPMNTQKRNQIFGYRALLEWIGKDT